jgi:hypothetical protein
MYLLELYYENAKHNRKGRFSIEIRDSSIPKWTLLPSGKQSSELFRMAALSLTGIKFLSNLASRAMKNIGDSSNWVQIGVTEGYSLYSQYKKRAETKGIFVYPLDKNFRKILCDSK